MLLVTFHDFDHVLLETDAANAIRNEFLYGALIDEVIAQAGGGKDRVYMITDALGSIRKVMDDQNVIRLAVEYNAYGELLTKSGDFDAYGCAVPASCGVSN